jgi:hypothetical protein
MRYSLPPLIRGWRAAMLLAAVALSSPGRASAECGDYITVGGKSAMAHHEPAPDTPATTPTAQSETRPAAPGKRPCRGPNCSASPAKEFPPVPPAPSAGPQAKEHARLPETARDSGADPRDPFARDNTSPRPIRRATSVFHPPRIG